jgi:predicted dehydrogenase
MSDEHNFRWGILGTGWIADRFVTDLKLLSGQKAFAVGSRSLDTAKQFAKDHSIEKSYASYDDLVADPEIDAIYVATPHPYHCAHTLLALEAGKSVLVEKPFAMDAQESSQMINLARKKGLFLMEAMWTRFLPHIIEIRKLLASGSLGDLVALHADHGQWFEKNQKHRLYAPELGGGALLDLGIYPVSFASMVLGKPLKITALGEKAFTGVDAQTSIILQYGSGVQAVLTTTLAAQCPNRGAIMGSKARIEIDGAFYTPTSFRVISKEGKILQHFNNTYEGNGLREEALEVARCIKSGLKESPFMPLNETLEIMKTLDEIRSQIGLKY